MRAVLDTNVLVAAVLSGQGAPRQLLEEWLGGRFELVSSPRLIDEVRRVLTYPKIRTFITEEEAEELVRLIETTSVHLPDVPGVPSIRSSDPDDDYLIALAASSQAALVTGDRGLQALAGMIPVFTPRRFHQLLDEIDRSGRGVGLVSSQ